jgi:SPP1 family predicted phage head-tail adaptor
MRADMREKITIRSRSTTQNSYGEELGWVDFQSGVWASREPLLGNEFITAQATNSRVEAKFRCHYFDGLLNEMQVVHGSDVYEILSAVNVKSLNREWLLYVRKVVVS